MYRAGQEQEETNMKKLQGEHISLLTERAQAMKALFDTQGVSMKALTLAEMDVMRARIEYAVDTEKPALYSELIAKYDVLIEIAELELEMPPRQGADEKWKRVLMEPALLKLKSDQVAVRIEKEMLEQK